MSKLNFNERLLRSLEGTKSDRKNKEIRKVQRIFHVFCVTLRNKNGHLFQGGITCFTCENKTGSSY